MSNGGDNTRVPSITFFFPYREVSGVPVLFLRMAETLSERFGLDARIVDYADGVMARNRKPGSKVRLEPFEDGIPIEIPGDTVLVIQSVLPYAMRPELRLSPATRIVFWTLHPLNFVQTIIPLPFFRDLQTRSRLFHLIGMRTLFHRQQQRVRDLIHALQRKRSLVFMDGQTLKMTRDYVEVEIDDPVFVPVPTDEARANVRKADHWPQGALTACWIGRLADFKIHILIHTMSRLRDFAARRRLPVTMDIVGEGPEAHRLEPFDVDDPYFRIRRLGTLSKDRLDAYLLREPHLVTAMGTSALEAARLGVPALLLDVAYGPVPDGYRFKWLFESKDFSLGDVLDESRFERGNRSLDERINQLFNDYQSISDKTFDYYKAHHDIGRVSEEFLSVVERAAFTYADFDPAVFSKGLIRQVYEAARRRSWRCAGHPQKVQ